MAILLGHHEINAPGVFNNLADLKPGAKATISDGTTVLVLQLISVRTKDLPKVDATKLYNALVDPPKGTRVALVTCFGEVVGDSHLDNAVAYFSITAVGVEGK